MPLNINKIGLLTLVVIFSLPALSQAQLGVPGKINVQALVRDASGDPVDMSYPGAEVALFDADAGGTEVWADTMDITITDGLVSLTLDVDSNIFAAYQNLWFELRLSDDLVVDRRQMVSVPYAYYADTSLDAELLGGQLPSYYVQTSNLQGTINSGQLADECVTFDKLANCTASQRDLLLWDGSGWVCSDIITIASDGNVGINQASPSSRLEVSGSIRSSATIYWGESNELGVSEGANIELKGHGARPYIDFAYDTANYDVRLRMDTQHDRLIVSNDFRVDDDLFVDDNAEIGGNLTVGEVFYWGSNSFLRTDQGGSIELHGTGSGGTNTPYIDFAMGTNDYDMRMIIVQPNEMELWGGSLTATVNPPSDERYKKNTVPLKDALDKVSRLQGITYNWRTDKFPEMGFSEDPEIGFIAQDVEAVVPELVKTSARGFKTLSYDKMTALLVEAVKEQQKQIKTQQEQIESLKSEIRSLKSK